MPTSTSIAKVSTKPKATAITPNQKDMRRHLKLLHGKRQFCVQIFKKNERCTVTPFHKPSEEATDDLLAELAALSTAHAEVGIVPNVMDGKGRKKSNCVGIHWLFVDCDTGKNTTKTLMNLAVPPDFIVESSPGHLHPYWRVRGCSVEQWPAMQTALAQCLGEENSVADPSRCMRLAGTLNNKREEPSLAKIVHPQLGDYKAEKRSIDEFSQAMGLVPAKANKADKIDGDSGELNEERVLDLLKDLDPGPRPLWLKVGKAIHSRWPDIHGYKMWTSWSKRSAKFDAETQRTTWSAFKANGGVTLGSLVELASGGAKAKAMGALIPSSDEREFADAVARAATGKLAYAPDTKTWWRFNGCKWESSKGDHQALKFVRDFLDALAREVGDPKAVAHLTTVARMAAAVKQAQLDDQLWVTDDCFDADPYLLGVKNGVIDLRTGTFRLAKPDDWITRTANVIFDESAKCPRFRAFLKSVSDDRKPLYKYILNALGYTLTGETKEHKWFMPLGKTRNGKGVLLHTMAEILGDYTVDVNPMLVMRAYSGNPNAPSPALMKLRGARLLLCTEMQARKSFDEAFIKQLTGGDKLVGREGYGAQTEFKVVGKLWLSTNQDPEIAYGADAMWQRIAAIPFDKQFLGEDADRDLEKKLLAEAPGILNLLMKYAREYIESGLPSCPLVEETNAKLRERLDTVKSWIDQCCREVEGAKLRSSDAHKSYARFCSSIHREPLGAAAFKTAMMEKGIRPTRRSDSNYFDGIRLLHK